MGEINPYNVKVGQLWADNDWRAAGRQLRILDVGGTHATARVEVDRQAYIPSDSRVGKETRIKLTRFKPTSTGYRLIKEN